MNAGCRSFDRFWIAFVVRLGIGMLFLVAALNIFFYLEKKQGPSDSRTMLESFRGGVDAFVEDLSGPFAQSWLNFKWKGWPRQVVAETNSVESKDLGIEAVKGFLYAMPFIFLILAVMILTGIGHRFGLRLAALYLVILGIGKYITGDAATTAQDFVFAGFCCLGLFLSRPASGGDWEGSSAPA